MKEQPTIAPTYQRVVNKAAAAMFFGVSPQSIDGWIRRGCPAVERGAQGKQWKFDLLDLAKWRFGLQAGEDGSIDPSAMTPKDRLDHYRALREQSKHQQEVGELISSDEYERALSTSLKQVAMMLESLPDLLERDAGLSGAAVEKSIAVVDALRERLYKALSGA
jgi:phage terminase Nu1 subunit (DNA packaging protein)